MISKLRKTIENVDIAVYSLYEAPTVHDLADLLSQQPETTTESDEQQTEAREAKRQETLARRRETRSDI